MSGGNPAPGETKPVVFKTPTLGHAVRLGELYDQRSGKFLGVQLYAQDKIEAIETDIRHTDLTLSLSTTLEDKASLLDINAKLSLEIMSGLISVSGSASYVKDTKSNTNEQAFALALKMRLNEKRMLFAEDMLGRNILDIASEDYIKEDLATHFVSAIVLGGNLIVNLVAKQSKMETDEKLEGQLQAKFEKLKGAISLEGEVKAQIKDKFKEMNDRFDLVMHGDVALESVPINPQDVLEIIPKGASLITKDGGVPISVTLQPIPKRLIRASKVWEIDARIVDEIMETFSQLDDLHSRFSVLVDGAKSVEEFVPELAKVTRNVAEAYSKEHRVLLHGLRDFLFAYQHGKGVGSGWKIKKQKEIAASEEEEEEEKEEEEEEPKDKETPVLERAKNLCCRHRQLDLHPDDDAKHSLSSYYPSTLAGLEVELLKFQHFVSDIQRLRDSVMPLHEKSKQSVSLSSIDEICRAIRFQNTIPLFIMTPFIRERDMHPGPNPCSSKTPTTTATPATLESNPVSPKPKLNPDLAIVRFLALIRKNAAYFNNLSSPPYIAYAEIKENLQKRLGGFSDLENPTFCIGNVDDDGEVSWDPPPPLSELSLKLKQEYSQGKIGNLSYIINGINGKESFSFQVRAKAGAVSSDKAIVCLLQTSTGLPYLELQIKTLRVEIQRNLPGAAIVKAPADPSPGTLFVVTFVQNIVERTWNLYLGKDKLEKPVWFRGTGDLIDASTKVQLVFPSANVTWWNGEVQEFRAYSYALTQEQVEVELKK